MYFGAMILSKIRSQKRIYSKKKKRIGVLGGTFDPPHLAHLHMADSAKEALNLDYIVFMPLGVPPHGKTGLSSTTHRINMIDIILAERKVFLIDAYEVQSNAPSYTVNSAKRINEILGEGSKVYFIIGADSLMYLEKWYDAKTLFNIAEFAVIPRSGVSKEACLGHIEVLRREFDADIVYIEAKELDYSSTKIRENYNKKDVTITTKEVVEYIKANRLYEDK